MGISRFRILAKLLRVVVEMLGYVVLSTVVFLLLGFVVYELLALQEFVDLSVFFAFEGCAVMFFGAILIGKSPPYVFKTTNRSMSWVPIRQLRENLKGAVIFGCSGFLVFVIGLQLTLMRSLTVRVSDVLYTLTVELLIMIIAVIAIGVLAAVFLLRRRKTESNKTRARFQVI